MNRLLSYLGIICLTILAASVLKSFVIDAVYIPSRSMENTLMSGDYVIINKLIHRERLGSNEFFERAVAPFFKFPLLKNIKRGDILVFIFPENSTYLESEHPVKFVKRCLGSGGDTIVIRDRIIYVNGQSVKMPAQISSSGYGNIGPVIIPRKGDRVEITSENYLELERVILQEGHSITQLGTSEILIDGNRNSSYTFEKNYLFVIGDNIVNSFDSRYWGFLPEENVVGEAMMIYWSVRPERPRIQNGGFLSAIRWNRIGKILN